MVKVVPDVMETAAAVSKKIEAPNFHLDILKVYGGLCYSVDDIRPRLRPSLQRRLRKRRRSNVRQSVIFVTGDNHHVQV